MNAIGSSAVATATALGIVWTRGQFGLIATGPIDAGSRLFRAAGEVVAHPSRLSIQIGRGRHLDVPAGASLQEQLDRYPWRFLNHSCAPNAAFRGRDLTAIRAIAAGEPICFDYNTTEFDMAHPFACSCGASHCLGTVRGFGHLDATQRARVAPHAMPHVLRAGPTS